MQQSKLKPLKRISTPEILRIPKPRCFAFKILISALIIIGCAMGIMVLEPWLAKFVLMVIIGAMLAHWVELEHQTLHGTGLGNSRLDSLIGTFLGWLSTISFSEFRFHHFRHHKFTGTHEDRESFAYAYELMKSPSRLTRLVGILKHFSLFDHYRKLIKSIILAIGGKLATQLKNNYPEMSRSTALKIQRDYRVIGTFIGISLLSSIGFKSLVPIQIWLMPLVISFGAVHALIELPEHWFCDFPNPNPLENTRSVQGGWFAKWFTNYNGAHVAHHYDAQVIPENAYRFEELLNTEFPIKHQNISYWQFYAEFLREMVR